MGKRLFITKRKGNIHFHEPPLSGLVPTSLDIPEYLSVSECEIERQGGREREGGREGEGVGGVCVFGAER